MSNPSNFHHYTDIQHYRKYRHLLEAGLPVRITEKIDGCLSRVGLLLVDGEWRFVAGSRSRVEERDSVYWEPLSREGVLNLLTHVCDNWTVDGDPTNDVIIFGVLCGPEEWRVFDISVNGTYLGRSDLILLCLAFGVQTVPVLYTGPFAPELVERFTYGATTVAGDVQSKFKGREGIVITLLTEQCCHIGRLILKNVSADYLDRKGAKDEGEI